MPRLSSPARVSHDTRMCLACGYRGPELQRRVRSPFEIYECPSCGEDLYARPARSYAELEGFVATERALQPRIFIPTWADEPVKSRTARRARSSWRRLLERVVLAMLVITAAVVIVGSTL